ncbi:hypothetical protein AK833_17995 [Lysinibacillus sp. F5]|nr:hypothetical protein AK833_17995 [Lysinibacillus sp. F5]
MDIDKITNLSEHLISLNLSEWNRIKQAVDTCFSSKVAKVELDDSKELKQNLMVTFHLQRSE